MRWPLTWQVYLGLLLPIGRYISALIKQFDYLEFETGLWLRGFVACFQCVHLACCRPCRFASFACSHPECRFYDCGFTSRRDLRVILLLNAGGLSASDKAQFEYSKENLLLVTTEILLCYLCSAFIFIGHGVL